MKIWKVTGMILIILGILGSVAGCGTVSDQSDRIKQAEVVRGDLTANISGNGKIGVINDAKLSFGSSGRQDVLKVKEGDKVKKGDLLAKLDTSALELSLSSAKTNQAAANAALTAAETLQTNADINLSGAKVDLEAITEVKELKDKITDAEWELKIAQAQADESRVLDDDYSGLYWLSIVGQAQGNVYKRQRDLADLLGETEYEGYAYALYEKYDRITVEAVRIKQNLVKAAEQSVQTAAQNVETARATREQTAKAVAYYQEQLNEAFIIAPFDGTVATTYYKQGDLIPVPAYAPQVVIYLVDTENLEVDVNIKEKDIQSVQIGQSAKIKIDVLPGTTLEGRVSSIATLPNAQSAAAGATTYITKVNFSVPAGMDIKPGLNAGVDIITAEHKGVLLLPAEAVKMDNQGQVYVEVINNKAISSQQVVTGVKGEGKVVIVSGLKEGDKVVNGVTGINYSLH